MVFCCSQAHGAEILCSRYDTGEEGAVGGAGAEAAAAAQGASHEGVRWQRFLAALSEKGYFKVIVDKKKSMSVNRT